MKKSLIVALTLSLTFIQLDAKWWWPFSSKPLTQTQLDKKLDTAAYFGRVKEMKSLIAQGASVNAKDSGSGFTILQGAALESRSLAKAGTQIEVIKLLLAHGADPNVGDNRSNTPLHFASHPEVIALLVSHGAKINTQNQFLKPPLHIAAMKGHTKTVKALIEHGADISLKTPPLDWIRRESIEVIEACLEHGFANLPEDSFRTVLDLAEACTFENRKTMQPTIDVLRAAGAKT